MNDFDLQRASVLRDLVEFRVPVAQAAAAMAMFPWDSERELVTFTRADGLRAIARLARGVATGADLRAWAEALEGRDDVGLEPGAEGVLKDFLFALATPELEGELTPEAAANWETALRHALGER